VTSAVLTPFVKDAALKSDRRTWRKRLLPVGEVSYKGRVLKFTEDYLKGLASAFQARAYDQVPFQLAGDDNRHTNDVERYAGDITDMRVEPDGLYITLAATERGHKVMKDNPRCGVSARIVEGYDRSDGKFFPAAVQHVLATLDPRIPGLGAWQAIEASNTIPLIDLSGYEFSGQERGGTAVAELTEEQKASRLAKLLEIPEDQIDAILAGIQKNEGESEAAEDEPSEDDLVAWIDGMSDEELLALEREFEAEAGTVPVTADEGELEPALSGDAPGALEMALEMNAVRTDETVRQLSVIQDELDDQRYASERDKLARSSGIPPYITDLAKPLLHGSNHVVDLAGGGSVDAGQVMRKVLTEMGKMISMLDLTPTELGTPMDEPDGAGAQGAEDERTALISAFRSQVKI
jgi:hypothetical protein